MEKSWRSCLDQFGHRSAIDRFRTDDPAFRNLFPGMRDPAQNPSASEHGRKGRAWDIQRLKQNGGVEFDIRFQRAIRVLTAELSERFAFNMFGKRDPARRPRQTTGGRFQGVGTRVAGAVAAVAEPHQTLSPGQGIINPRLGICLFPNRIEHVEDRSRRTAMQGAFQSR